MFIFVVTDLTNQLHIVGKYLLFCQQEFRRFFLSVLPAYLAAWPAGMAARVPE